MTIEGIQILGYVIVFTCALAWVLRFASINRPGLLLSQTPEWSGVINNESFRVHVFATDAWSVVLKYPENYVTRFVANMRLEQSNVKNNEIAEILDKLAQRGVDLVDFGVHSNWIAAEVPFIKAALCTDNAAQVAELLRQLKVKMEPIKTKKEVVLPKKL